ncbi:MAG: WD40 repeat domain-containing protein, partial [Microcystaceae cyanobacterium]
QSIEQYSAQLRLVFTLRSDFEPQFQDTPLKERWQNSRFLVSPMTRSELREVIEKPAEARVMYFQPHQLVEQCIDEVADMPGALPLLSFALSELYLKYLKRQREGEIEGKTLDRALTLPDYQELGGVIQSLTQRADQEYEKLVKKDPNYAQMICQVMLRMVAVSGGELTRRRVYLSELAYPPEKNHFVKEILKTFTDSRLLVTGEDNEGNPYVEPAHDALVRGWQRLLRWKQENEESLLLQRRLTPAALEWESQQKAQFLWNTNPRLDLLKKVLDSDNNWLNALERDFIKRSIAKRSFNTRRNWGIAIAVILGLSAGLIFSLIGQRNTLIEQAGSSQKSAEGKLLDDHSLDGMIDSLEAVNALQHPLVQTPFLMPFSSSEELQTLQKQVADTLQWAVYQVRETNRLEGESNIIVRSVISPNNQMIASAGENGEITLWDLTGRRLQKWQEGSQRVRSVTFGSDNRSLISAGEDGMVRIWDLEAIKLGNIYPSKEIQAHQGHARFAILSPNAQMIASVGGQDGMLYLWNKEGKELNSWPADQKKLARIVAFHPNGKVLVTAGKEKNVKIWNLQGQLLQVLDYHAWWVSFSADGKYILAAGDDGTIALCQYQEELCNNLKIWNAHKGRLWKATFSPDSQKIASVGDDGIIRIWTLNGELITQVQGHIGPTRSVSFMANSQQIISSGDDGTTRLWNLSKQLIDTQSVSVNNDHKTINKLILNPQNSNQLFAISTIDSDGKIKIEGIQTKNMSEKNLKDYPYLEVNDLSISPNQELLASAGKEGDIMIWSLKTGKRINLFKDHIGEVLKVSFDSTSQKLVSAGEDNTIRVWERINEPNQGRYSSIFQVDKSDKTDNYKITDVIFSPDNQNIVNSDSVGYIRFWSLTQIQLISIWQASPYPINNLDFSSQGDLLVNMADQEENPLKFPLNSLDELIPIGCQQIDSYLHDQSLNNVNSLSISLCN